MLDDDDDDYLYGSGNVSRTTSQIIEPMPVNGDPTTSEVAENTSEAQEAEGEDDQQDYEQDTEDEEDVEIIMDAPVRSIDFRQNTTARKPPATAQARSEPVANPALTTEYTPIQRGGSSASITSLPSSSQPPLSTFGTAQPSTPVKANGDGASEALESRPTDDGVDPTTLPSVEAPPSHPHIDPDAVGTLDGRSILDVDLNSMADKAWRRPGVDISDYFNYGFDEISYEAYCYRRRDMGELANVLKTNVLIFSGMSEDQVVALPSEVRQMVMTGTSAMMNQAANPAMMAPMMDVSGMMPMGMGMGADMGMAPQMMGVDGTGMLMGDSTGRSSGPNATNEQGMNGVGMDSFNAGNMMAMNMGTEFANQDPAQGGQMFDAPSHPRGGPPTGPYRGAGRGAPPGAIPGRGFAGRGRGRGTYSVGAPVRSTSPLPPNVPTGPRNQNKYKDRDGISAAVDGLDYGGNKDSGRRSASGEPEDRGRKRRGSPGMDEGRSSKRR